MEDPNAQPLPGPAEHDIEMQNQNIVSFSSRASSPVSAEHAATMETNPITSHFQPCVVHSPDSGQYSKCIDRLEKQIRALKQELFQLASYYFVFQGVILTALFGGSSYLKCQYSWYPMTLSATAGVINLIALIWDSMRLTRLIDLKEQMVIDGFQPDDIATQQLREDRTSCFHELQKKRRRIIMWSSVILLICFIFVLQLGTWKILCGQSDCSSSLGRIYKNCIKLCSEEDKCMLFCPQS